MEHHISDAEAQAALRSIDYRRQQVIAEIDMPGWYWWGLAIGWVALGVIADLGNGWVTTVALFLFGVGHSIVCQRVLSGRHGSPQLSVRADVVNRYIPALVIGYLLALTALTIVLAVVLNAAGVDFAITLASVVVAVAVLVGGPALMRAVRRRAARAIDVR